MKKLLALLSLSFVILQASGALPFYDPFADATGSGGSSYTVGSGLATQNNSGNTWDLIGSNFGSTQPTIVAGNLSLSNMPPSFGNSVTTVPANSQAVRLNLNATVTSGRVYYSFILKITNIDAVPSTNADNFFSGFGDGTGGSTAQLLRIGSRILTKKSGSGYVFGTSKSRIATTFVYDTNVFAVNDTVFLVAAYEQLAGNSTNALLWINPATSTLGSTNVPPPTLTVSTIGVPADGLLNTSGVRSFILLCQNTNAPTTIINDVRVSTNWAFVTGGDPAILQNPVNRTLPPGTNTTFSVVARGTPTLTYQWIKDGTTLLTDSGNISGANTATLSIGNISAGDVGSYAVVVTNSLGSFVQSSNATLSLSNPAITSQPQSRTNDFGTTATFQVTATGTAPFGYQWHKIGVGDLTDGGNISGSHSNVLTITVVTFPDGGSYSVTVSNAIGATADSAIATLTVRDPIILTQPSSTTNYAGSNVTFTVVAGGTPPFIYQWMKNGVTLSDVGNIFGATTTNLTISSISAADAATYSVVVTGGFVSSENSAGAVLTVLSPVAITAPPSPRAVTAGNKVVFAVGVTGTSPIGYQWQRSGTNITGATAFSYTITNAQASDAGSYTVIVSNFINAVTNSSALLTILPNLRLSNTNLVVIRIGDGAQALSLNGNSMSLDQFAKSGTYINTFEVPEQGPSAMLAIGMPNVNGTSGNITGSGLTRSADGRLMVLAGYNTNLGYSSALASAVATSVPRGVGVIDAQGQYSLAVTSTASIYSQAAWRAAITDGTNNFWGCANKGGTYYFGFTAPEGPVQSLISNVRSIAIFNGNIYFAAAVTGAEGIFKLDGLPVSGAPAINVFTNGNFTADMEVSADGNLIYVADELSGILRYQFDGTTWSLAYALNSGLSDGARHVAVDFTGPSPLIYAISRELDNNRIVAIQDSGAGSPGTTIASAGVNQVFRGMRFGPVGGAVAPTLLAARDGNNIILSWSGTFLLQSSTNVASGYTTISGATSPYTNSLNSAAQQFFRLRD